MKAKAGLIAATLSLLPLGQPLPLLLATLTATTTELVLQASPALAQDASAVARIAKEITVKIDGSTQGSGVLIHKVLSRYRVITAWHVVKDIAEGEEVTITTSDGKEHEIEQGSIQRLGEVDLATLIFNSSDSYKVASIGDVRSVPRAAFIQVAGYPLPSLDVPRRLFRIFKGEVITNSDKYLPDGYQVLYSNPTLPGISGGSVLNSQGELVAIHGKAEKDINVSTETGKAVSTGTNQGIPIHYYKLYFPGNTGQNSIDAQQNNKKILSNRSFLNLKRVVKIMAISSFPVFQDILHWWESRLKKDEEFICRTRSEQANNSFAAKKIYTECSKNIRNELAADKKRGQERMLQKQAEKQAIEDAWYRLMPVCRKYQEEYLGAVKTTKNILNNPSYDPKSEYWRSSKRIMDKRIRDIREIINSKENLIEETITKLTLVHVPQRYCFDSSYCDYIDESWWQSFFNTCDPKKFPTEGKHQMYGHW